MTKNVKKAIAILIAVIMCLSVTEAGIYAKAVVGDDVQGGWDGVTTVNEYFGENFKVTFVLSSYWNGGYNANVKIENIGSSIIENWYMKFTLNNNLTNIWNAEEVSNEKGKYVVKNAGWNADIPVGECVEFGLSVNENFNGFPSDYKLLGESVQVSEEAYSVEYILDNDWGSGFTGRILLTNNTDETIEDWILEFDFDRKITSVWDGVIDVHENNHYVIKNAGYNANIAAGQTISFGFSGEGGTANNIPGGYKVISLKYDVNEDVIADTDGDGVPDDVEIYFDMDTNKEDTDGDGLPDYAELYETDTEPTLIDSDEDGINDGDEDSDEDQLTNAHEVALGTNATRSDTDGDGLADGKEVKELGTDPLKVDTDEDGLTDEEELILGLDPKKQKSDGITPDDERTFIQNTDDSVKDEALKASGNWLVPSIAGEVTGVISNNIRMYKSSVYALDSNRSVVSDIIGVYTAYEVPVTLTFSYNKEYTGDIKNLNIMTYTEEGLNLVDTVTDEEAGKISAAISKSGMYFVLDLNEFLRGLGIDVFNNISTESVVEVATFASRDMNVSALNTEAVATGKADVVFVIDTTGSMSNGISGVKNNISSFSKALAENYNIDVNFALCEYRDITVDGKDSTVLHKNISSNWFTNVDTFINEVKALTVAGGGDYAETPIDGLEMARVIDWRGDAVKFVILVTDATYKNNNFSGIADMSQMAQRLDDSGIITSVIAASENHYDELTVQTGGLYGYIYGDFSTILLQLSDMVGKTTNAGGQWVMLSDYQTVKLSATLENAATNDTDGDGYSDAKELGISKEVDMSECISCLLNKHNIFEGCYIGKTALKVWNYTTNPTLIDTDFDGISDGTLDYDGSVVDNPDENPRRFSWNSFMENFTIGEIGNAFIGEVTANGYTFDLSFIMDYTMFFDDFSLYKRDLSKLGIIYSIGAYHNDIIIDYGADFSGDDEEMMKQFGMKDVTPVKLADEYTDDDISEITMGHREVTYQGVTKDIIFVTVRGTDGTIEEWSSNFDVGADTDDYWDRNNTDWENKDNHKGFDVTANRLEAHISDYIKNLNANTEKVIFFTGHSRGAAIANILASMYVDLGYNTVAYTMATPNTTLEEDAESKYDTIFNIVNEDDIVPYLPLEAWGYKKYGKTYVVSVEDSYENHWGTAQEGTWEAMFGGDDYNANGKLNDTLREFKKIADNREELYVYTGELNTMYTYDTKYDTKAEVDEAAIALKERYGTRINRFAKFYTVEKDSFWDGVYYQVMVEQTPAAMMMILTDVIGKKQHIKDSLGNDKIDKYKQRGVGEDTYWGEDISFYVAQKYDKAKTNFVWSGCDSAADLAMSIGLGGMVHTHMPGTYYLIVDDSESLLP